MWRPFEPRGSGIKVLTWPRGVIAACDDLGSPAPRPSKGNGRPSMRWALAHMIEETGRHAGHLDILRELADGTTGR
jgi:hypothetical protein